MKTLKDQQESTSEINRRRTANRNAILVGVLLFIALVVGSGATAEPGGALTAKDLVWGGLSVLGFACMLLSLYVSYRQADERQQQIQLRATSITFVAVIFSLVCSQILEALAIVDLRVSIQIIVIGSILLWMSMIKVVEHRRG